MAVEVSPEAEQLKVRANECFSRIFLFVLRFNFFAGGKYSDAIEFYTKAINLKETAIFYANRSFAYLKMELFGAAVTDASKAIELDPNYIKVVNV